MEVQTAKNGEITDQFRDALTRSLVLQPVLFNSFLILTYKINTPLFVHTDLKCENLGCIPKRALLNVVAPRELSVNFRL